MPVRGHRTSYDHMHVLRALLFGMLTLALLLAPPLSAEFHLHGKPGAEMTDPVGLLTADQDHRQADHGHSHDDDEPGHANHKPHNPGDHSHETAVAARLINPLLCPLPKTVVIFETMVGRDGEASRLERPPRQSW
ncbi:MAG: hypothetical protein O9314_02585 [Microcystis sp. LE19-4.1E]|nr:hypothetical protein [Microcystis sp. LE19-4.1E]